MPTMKIILLLPLLLTTACSSGMASTGQAPNSPEPAALQSKPLPVLGDSKTQFDFQIADLNAIIGKQPRPVEPQTLAVLAGNPPPGVDVCNLPYSALTQKMYLSCFPEGISYVGMSNVIGWAGEEVSRSGNTVGYIWRGTKGSFLMATFTDGKLTAKSQQGLK